MKNGRVVEHGRAEQIFDAPADPYTQALMKAVFELEAVESGVVSM
jgi:microcin C transport system ATP-binding protein